jgi:hypothetical protein
MDSFKNTLNVDISMNTSVKRTIAKIIMEMDIKEDILGCKELVVGSRMNR